MDKIKFDKFLETGMADTDEHTHIRGCIQKFPDWAPGARTANGTALCH
jgi:hypothetical protein